MRGDDEARQSGYAVNVNPPAKIDGQKLEARKTTTTFEPKSFSRRKRLSAGARFRTTGIRSSRHVNALSQKANLIGYSDGDFTSTAWLGPWSCLILFSFTREETL